jgi:hypothetical protein
MIQVQENIYNSTSDESLSNTIYLMGILTNTALKDKTFLKFISIYFIPFINNADTLFKKLWLYARNNFTYKSDYYDEVLISPAKMIFIKIGDCDDFSLFIYTVLKALNFKPYYILLGKNNNEFSHIAVWINDIVIDATNPNYNNIPDYYINKKLVNYG